MAVLLLGEREQLHGLIRVVSQDELLTAGKFLILVGVILPLVPHQPLMAATPLTPYHVWLAVVAVCTLSYISYLLQKYAPVRNATLVPAILGGIYSSSATTLVLARRQREAAVARSDLAAGIVTATTMMYLRLEVIIAVFNLRFAWALAPAMGTLFAIGAALAVYEWRGSTKRQSDWSLQLPTINPLQIPAAMIFAAIFVVISVVSAAIRDTFGQTGVLTLAALVGVTDIDPFVINIAQGGVTGLSISALCAAILIAASSNNIAKGIYALGFGGGEFSRRPALMHTRSHGRKIYEIMTPDPVTVTEETPLEEVVRSMEKRRIKRLPVMRGNEVVGIVTRANLVHALAGLARDATPSAASDQAIRDRIVAEQAGQSWAPAALLNITVKDGVVELWGTITDERERAAIKVAAENAPGVKAVNDHLAWVDAMSGLVFGLSDQDPVQAKAS